jgi:hypothetical protein
MKIWYDHRKEPVMNTSRTLEAHNAQHECPHGHENINIEQHCKISRKHYTPPIINRLDSRDVQGGQTNNVLEATASGILTS